jgi:hypothetical protein
MVRRKTTLRAKSGGYGPQNGNGNGNPRALVDENVYREFKNFQDWVAAGTPHHYPPFWDAQYSGWSNGSRPRDYPIFLHPIGAGAD